MRAKRGERLPLALRDAALAKLRTHGTFAKGRGIEWEGDGPSMLYSTPFQPLAAPVLARYTERTQT